MSAIDDLAAMQGPDPIAAAEQLNALLSLPESASVRGARVTGQGSRAAVEIDLANGETMVFDSLRDLTRPAILIAEVAACAGVAVALKQPAAVQAVVLVRAMAEHARAINDGDAAAAWGLDYLQAATILDIDMDNQRERWAAFGRLRDVQGDVERAAVAPERGTNYAASTIVLRSLSGARYVRAGWFQRYVSREDSTISRLAVTGRMLRVGWQIRGNTGRIKATCPGRADTLAWSFLLVPDGWETGR